MADTGTGPITTSGTSTPQDELIKKLLDSVVGPTANSILDVSSTATKEGTANTTATKTGTETGTTTKAGGTGGAQQLALDQQINELKAQLGDNSQYVDLVHGLMTNAATAFNPTNMASRRAGAYDSTALEQLRNDAMSKATAGAADAILQDKRAKLAQLDELVTQSAKINATETSSTSNTSSTSATSSTTENDKAVTEANRIGKNAANIAKAGSAALIAKQLLSSDAGKKLTGEGLSALKKLFDVSGTSTGLPANWFEDLSSVVADPSAVVSEYTDTIKNIFGDVNETGLPDGWFDDAAADVFGSGEEAASALTELNLLPSDFGLDPTAGAFAALTSAMDGEWGWSDTGKVAGSAIGSFFGGPIGGAIGGTIGSAIGEPVGDLIEGVGGRASDALESTGLGFVEDIFDGCFITTACMKALRSAFDDNCEELTAMRDLRDQYVAQLPNGRSIINDYYSVAPKIVAAINLRPDAANIWHELYYRYIAEAVNDVQHCKMKKAYVLYLSMVARAKQLAGLGD